MHKMRLLQNQQCNPNPKSTGFHAINIVGNEEYKLTKIQCFIWLKGDMETLMYKRWHADNGKKRIIDLGGQSSVA